MKAFIANQIALSTLSFLLMIPTVILIVLIKVWERRNGNS
jgi:hypothetical protein